MRYSSDSVAIAIVALGIVRHAGGSVLVQQHRTPAGDAVWSIPGGLVEPGELIADALLRELQEEAGVSVTAIGPLASFSQIDRPTSAMQTIVLIFEIVSWQGSLQPSDPDEDIVAVELVPDDVAISRLEANGGWPGFEAPLCAYLRGEIAAGTHSFYREGSDGFAGQAFVARVPM